MWVLQYRHGAIGRHIKPASDLLHYETQSVLALLCAWHKVTESNMERKSLLATQRERERVGENKKAGISQRNWLRRKEKVVLWWWTEDENRKADKQTRLSVRVWYFRDAGFLPVLVRPLLWPPPRLSGRLIPAQTLALCCNLSPALNKNSTLAFTSVGTSEKAGCVFHPGLFVSLSFTFFVSFFFCLSSLSLFLSFFLSSTLFLSLLILMHLWDCTPRLALRLQAVLMHQLVCCLDSHKVKRADGGGK